LYEQVGMFEPSSSGTPTLHFMMRATSKVSSSMCEWM